MEMTKTSFCRVILNFETIDNPLDDWERYLQSDDIHVMLNEKIETNWHFIFHTVHYHLPSNLLILLVQDKLEEKTNGKIVNVYIQSGNSQVYLESPLESHKQDLKINNRAWRHEYKWSMNKDRLLSCDDLTQIEIVFNVRLKDQIENKVETLQSLSAKAAMKTLQGNNYMDKVLDYLHFAVTLKAQPLEDKCLSLILLSYNNLKQTEKWKNLRPSLKNKIVDLFNETGKQTVKMVEIEKGVTIEVYNCQIL